MIKRLLTIKNIQTKLFLFLVVLVLSIVSSISIVIYLNQKSILFDQAKERAFNLTRTLAYSSVTAILTDEYITLQLLIDSMSDDKDILAITIVDTKGKIIAANISKLRGTLLNDTLTKKSLLSETYQIQKGEQNIWDTAVPIFKLDERIGTARIKFSIDDTYSGLLETIFIIGFIALAISFFLSYMLSKHFTKPIHQAIELAIEYGKGNLDAFIEPLRDDEIGRLIQSLNLLSDNLKKVIDEKISLENLAMIGEFSSFIMHDLKNPIAGLSMLAEGIDQNIDDDDKLKKYSTELMITANRILAFLKTALAQSKPVEFDSVPIQINEVIKEALSTLNYRPKTIIPKLDDFIPKIQGDSQLLSRALLNILDNAIEAIGLDGVIKIESCKMDGNIQISVEDNGPGISNDKLATIFRPFYTEKKTGHGLGLSMVKKTVIAHKGKIEVISEVGHFTRFIIFLPINRQHGVTDV